MKDEHAIRDLVQTWMAATAEGDAETVLSLMTDDAVFLVPGRAPFGKAEFATAAVTMKGARFEGDSRIEEIVVAGDVAYMRAHLTVKTAADGKAPATRTGWTLTVLRKDAQGTWRLARDANLLA